ncbi:MAG: zinc ribbon domain-containing protein [Treponema sp.]|jgi:predicted RNA-binding Zn-ribbon protein involved in translation (DUF1610 family)|nr:zinc ribbon domain-containing protein [Treponema sp.]
MGKKPIFFCDNCGAEVPMSAKSCPRCGRFFASVRCPECGFTGQEEDFVQGCPECGYSSSPARKPPGADPPRGGNSKRRAPRSRIPGRTASREPALSPPLWLYLIAAVTLIGVLMLLYNALR